MENWGYKNWGAKSGALMAWILDQQYPTPAHPSTVMLQRAAAAEIRNCET